MWHFRLQSYERLKKKKYFTRQNLNLKATATQAAVAAVKISSDILFCREESAKRAEGVSQQWQVDTGQLGPQMIPLLGVSGLAVVPPGKLASHHDFLRLLFHHLHYNLTGFQGVPSICCKGDSKTKRTRCKEVSE